MTSPMMRGNLDADAYRKLKETRSGATETCHINVAGEYYRMLSMKIGATLYEVQGPHVRGEYEAYE